jgi:hypothetical protein
MPQSTKQWLHTYGLKRKHANGNDWMNGGYAIQDVHQHLGCLHPSTQIGFYGFDVDGSTERFGTRAD